MIRPFTCICMLLAAGSGLYLYQTKHRAQLLDREIGRTIKQTEQARDRIGALKGEWALLSEPDRLNELAAQHLALKTLAPTQFVAMADLGARLPAPLPPGAMMRPVDEPAPTTPMAVAKPVIAGPRVAEKTPERPIEKPVQVAALPQPAVPPPAPKAAAKPPVTPPAPPPIVAAAVAAPPRLAHPAPLPPPMPTPRILAPVMNVSAGQIAAPAPGSIGESVARAARVRDQAHPAATPVAPVLVPAASTAPAYSQQAATTLSGSALGGAGRLALPAPVPFGAVQR